MLRRSFVTLALAASLAACSSAPPAPIIDSVAMPPSAGKDTSGNYAFTGSVAAHSANGAITQIILNTPQQNGVAASSNAINVGTATSPFNLQLTITGAIPAGVYTYDFVVVDVAGIHSAPSASQTITLQ